jgi:hypothetical protein
MVEEETAGDQAVRDLFGVARVNLVELLVAGGHGLYLLFLVARSSGSVRWLTCGQFSWIEDALLVQSSAVIAMAYPKIDECHT